MALVAQAVQEWKAFSPADAVLAVCSDDTVTDAPAGAASGSEHAGGAAGTFDGGEGGVGDGALSLVGVAQGLGGGQEGVDEGTVAAAGAAHATDGRAAGGEGFGQGGDGGPLSVQAGRRGGGTGARRGRTAGWWSPGSPTSCGTASGRTTSWTDSWPKVILRLRAASWLADRSDDAVAALPDSDTSTTSTGHSCRFHSDSRGRHEQMILASDTESNLRRLGQESETGGIKWLRKCSNVGP